MSAIQPFWPNLLLSEPCRDATLPKASTAATPDILFRRKYWMQRIAPEGILLAVQLDLASVELSIKKTNTSGIR
jgi:hypothetical protein